MTNYSLFPATNGPVNAAAYTGPFQAGVAFQLTGGGLWLYGYRYWCCNNGQGTTPVTGALWQLNAPGATRVVVPGSSVTSGNLVAGQWNNILLATPIALSQLVGYEAVVGGMVSGFPETQNQYGLGDPYVNGITNGPLFAYSDASGTVPPPGSTSQGAFGTGSASGGNANANFPGSGSDSSANFWVDLIVSDQAPAGASYRIVPGQPYATDFADDTANRFTLATAFNLLVACMVVRIWFYSPAGVTQLPTDTGIWVVSSQTLYPGSHNASPAWSGAAGSTWISVDYTASGLVLPAGVNLKVSVANEAITPAIWNPETGPDYWAAPGPGANGITNGPVVAPSNAAAPAPGQASYDSGNAFAYPNTNAGPYFYWVDIEVTPVVQAVTGFVQMGRRGFIMPGINLGGFSDDT